MLADNKYLVLLFTGMGCHRSLFFHFFFFFHFCLHFHLENLKYLVGYKQNGLVFLGINHCLYMYIGVDVNIWGTNLSVSYLQNRIPYYLV